MLPGFAKQTAPLNDYEQHTLLPVIIRGLREKVGADKAITSKVIVAKMCAAGYKLSDVRLRKIINHIRNNHLVGCLVATNKGYYIATTIQEVDDFIESLNGRVRSIQEDIESMKQQKDYYFN